MNNEQVRLRAENIKALKDAFPHLNEDEAEKLQDKLYNLGRRAKTNAENYCNFPDYGAEYETTQARIKAAVDRLLLKYQIKVPYRLGGDPRGFCLKVMLPNGMYNSWGGAEEGWGFGG